MTNEEYLRAALASALRRHGENAFSVRQLRQQLASLEYFKKVKPALGTETFHIGARQGTPEDHPKANPLESREDMYGSVIPDDQEGSPPEAEEEKRQQEEES